MRIRTKILLSHLVLLAMVSLVCVGIVAALAFTNEDRRRLRASHEQLRNINLVAAEANRMSEQIAELFVLEGEAAAFLDARDALLARLDEQREMIVQEQILDGQLGAPWGSLERVEAMKRLVGRIDRSRAELQEHLEQGRRHQAELIYSIDIENRLDQTLGDLIERSMARERQEVEEVLARSERLSEQSMAMAVSLIVIVAAVGVGNVLVLNRTILRPISDLAAAADAVGEGNLSHVVGNGARDELGYLADRFNQMTRQLKEQRDSILRAKASLAEQVEARTRELRERTEELEATNAKLRAIDASRANFFADVSHELRTPITVLRGQAEVTLQNSAADQGELRAALEGCVRKADQIGRLVDDLLFLARSESGSIMVAREDVVLQDVISDALLDGRGLLRRDGVRILPRQPAKPLVVRGDADRIRQAVLIALDNAVKLAPAGSTVKVALATEGDRAVIRVRDEGPGFTEEELGSAFTRFYRGKASRARSGRGLGLGLAIAKWIVDQHEGSIRLESRPEDGATVVIALPLAAVRA